MNLESKPPRYKLIFYVPKENLEECKDEIFRTGAGTFPGGKYSRCCFESSGTGQFLPVAERGANPTIGQLKEDGSGEYRVERVEEVRCEIMCVGRDNTKRAVAALKKYAKQRLLSSTSARYSRLLGMDANRRYRAHPYEEVAYEVYKMEDF